MLESYKDFIGLQATWDTECYIEPQILYLAGGGVYIADKIMDIEPRASRHSGGFGQRYTVKASCEDEDAFGKLLYVYFEVFGTVGHWIAEDVNDFIDVTVEWDTDGRITPVSFTIENKEYSILKPFRKYPMSTRKSDGSGMRYIVNTVDPEGYRNDGRLLMLEHGGRLVGHWYYESIG